MKNKYIFFGIRVSSVVFVGAGDETPGGTQYRVPPLMLRTSPGSGLRNIMGACPGLNFLD